MPKSLGLNRTLGGAIGIIALVSVLSCGVVLITRNQLRDATDARSRSNLVFLRSVPPEFCTDAMRSSFGASRDTAREEEDERQSGGSRRIDRCSARIDRCQD